MRNHMIDTVIVSGGKIQNEFALDFLKKNIEKAGRENICLIAADRGLEFFAENQIHPDVVIGDFDSLSEKGGRYLESIETQEIAVCRLKPEKDDSDTQSALNYAICRGAKNILILGATGGRMDHLLANLGLLSLGEKKGARVILADRNNYVCLIPSGTVLEKNSQFGKYVSFFPVGGDVQELTLEGFRYPLNRHHLRVEDSGLTVSNEITEERACVTYIGGCLLMIMSRD